MEYPWSSITFILTTFLFFAKNPAFQHPDLSQCKQWPGISFPERLQKLKFPHQVFAYVSDRHRGIYDHLFLPGLLPAGYRAHSAVSEIPARLLP